MDKLKYRGKNRYGEFLSAARIIARKISTIDHVMGILATGGIGRGYCDDYSDLDLAVYVDDEKVKEVKKYIALGYLRNKEISLDTPVESYQKALSAKSPGAFWTQVMRWDRENSVILHDTKGRIKNLLREKLIFPEWERMRLLKKHRQAAEEHLLGYFETWEKRGNNINLADALLRGTEHVILWIYAKNRKFCPYSPKWLFYYLENDLLPESKYLRTLRKPYIESMRRKIQARRVREELLEVCKKIGMEFSYGSLEEIFEKERRNWEKTSEKTRYYLGW